MRLPRQTGTCLRHAFSNAASTRTTHIAMAACAASKKSPHGETWTTPANARYGAKPLRAPPPQPRARSHYFWRCEHTRKARQLRRASMHRQDRSTTTSGGVVDMLSSHCDQKAIAPPRPHGPLQQCCRLGKYRHPAALGYSPPSMRHISGIHATMLTHLLELMTP